MQLIRLQNKGKFLCAILALLIVFGFTLAGSAKAGNLQCNTFCTGSYGYASGSCSNVACSAPTCSGTTCNYCFKNATNPYCTDVAGTTCKCIGAAYCNACSAGSTCKNPTSIDGAFCSAPPAPTVTPSYTCSVTATYCTSTGNGTRYFSCSGTSPSYSNTYYCGSDKNCYLNNVNCTNLGQVCNPSTFLCGAGAATPTPVPTCNVYSTYCTSSINGTKYFSCNGTYSNTYYCSSYNCTLNQVNCALSGQVCNSSTYTCGTAPTPTRTPTPIPTSTPVPTCNVYSTYCTSSINGTKYFSCNATYLNTYYCSSYNCTLNQVNCALSGQVCNTSTYTCGTATPTPTPPIPPAPYGGTSSSITTNSAYVTWSGTLYSGGYYALYYMPSGGSWSGLGTGTNNYYTFPNNLIPGTYYQWYVQACNSVGACSTSSIWSFTTLAAPTPTRTPTPTTVPVPPAPTSGQSGMITSNSAYVTWSGTLYSGGYYYLYYRISGGGWSGINTGTNNSYTLTGLSSNTNYEWLVYAFNSVGNYSTSSTWYFTTLAAATPTPTRTPTSTPIPTPTTAPVPPAPTSGQSGMITSNSAYVTWSGTLYSGGYYALYYMPSGGSWSGLGTGTNNYYTFPNNLIPGTYYQWYVQACNSVGACSTSSIWSFTTLAAATPTPTPSCGSYSGCSNCISHASSQSCGWCFNDNSCYHGTSTQSDYGTCYGAGWTQTNCTPPTSTPTPSPTRTPTPTITPTPTTIPCSVATSPSSINLNVGETGVVTADVTFGKGLATINQMRFGSYNTSIATVNPASDASTPYSTVVTGIAAGNAAVWATADLSDGRTCESTGTTDTDIIVTAATPTPSPTDSPCTPGSTRYTCYYPAQYCSPVTAP